MKSEQPRAIAEVKTPQERPDLMESFIHHMRRQLARRYGLPYWLLFDDKWAREGEE